jgi:type II secretory pathway component PulC
MGMTKTKGLKWTALALLALAALLALRLAFGLRGASAARGASAPRSVAEVSEGFRWAMPDAGAWKLFRSGAPAAPAAAAGALSARWRLAGVFLVLSDTGRSDAEHRCAILDDLQTRQQYLAAEEEQLDDVRVVTVESDHVVLSDGANEETIFLAAGTLPGHEKTETGAPAAEEPKILETNRFGNRVGETRWEFNRQAILDYYQEMMDNPERLASLFMAMEADRDAEGKVAGYKLNMDVGEKEFYTQVGLQQGDVVRKANSMRMTSQRRAEYFIGEFVQNRLGAVVLDIERNGEPKKLVYLIK